MSKEKEVMGLHSTLRFGKYRGRTILEVLQVNSGYVDWASKNVTDFMIDNEVKARLGKPKFTGKTISPRNLARLSREMISAEEGVIDWYGPADFYLIEGDQWVKFGVTSDWSRRKYFYDQELNEVAWKVVKKEEYKTRWRAEFLEQMVVYQLRPFVFDGTREWVEKMKAKKVWKYVLDTKRTIEEVGWGKYEYIHKYGKNRWDHYKDKAMSEFDGIRESNLDLNLRDELNEFDDGEV